MARIVECIPNFSEGRRDDVIQAIARAVCSVDGVRLLHVDPGVAANRTVMTFVGEVELVVQAAFLAVQAASDLIDMRLHHGEHPRIGATDVMPLVPVSGITLEELVPIVRQLARRISTELGVPVYCYEAAAFVPQRVNLEACRSGEWEGLSSKIVLPEWKPDFGPSEFTDRVASSGLTVIGARDYLVAVNFNLSTSDVQIAKRIAADVRRERSEGRLLGVKAIGWYIAEYGFAQVSTNLTRIDQTPLHIVFEAVSRLALAHGVCVTGTELIGLVPRRVLVDAGRYWSCDSLSSGEMNTTTTTTATDTIKDDQYIALAIQRMGLSTIDLFDPQSRIIESFL